MSSTIIRVSCWSPRTSLVRLFAAFLFSFATNILLDASYIGVCTMLNPTASPTNTIVTATINHSHLRITRRRSARTCMCSSSENSEGISDPTLVFTNLDFLTLESDFATAEYTLRACHSHSELFQDPLLKPFQSRAVTLAYQQPRISARYPTGSNDVLCDGCPHRPGGTFSR